MCQISLKSYFVALVQLRQAKEEIVSASKVAYRFLAGVASNSSATPNTLDNSSNGVSRFQGAWFRNIISPAAKPSSSTLPEDTSSLSSSSSSTDDEHPLENQNSLSDQMQCHHWNYRESLVHNIYRCSNLIVVDCSATPPLPSSCRVYIHHLALNMHHANDSDCCKLKFRLSMEKRNDKCRRHLAFASINDPWACSMDNHFLQIMEAMECSAAAATFILICPRFGISRFPVAKGATKRVMIFWYIFLAVKLSVQEVMGVYVSSACTLSFDPIYTVCNRHWDSLLGDMMANKNLRCNLSYSINFLRRWWNLGAGLDFVQLFQDS